MLKKIALKGLHLNVASKEAYYVLAEFLSSKGAIVNAQDDNGSTPLIKAVQGSLHKRDRFSFGFYNLNYLILKTRCAAGFLFSYLKFHGFFATISYLKL